MGLEMDERYVQAFWNAHPCGQELVGTTGADFEEFLCRYDAFRYNESKHILKYLDALPLKGKRVLEIGLGLGADSEQIIRRGAIYSGVDLTTESVSRVKCRLRLRGLAYEQLLVGSACCLPFVSSSFDIVFSHGVLHHIPLIGIAQAEIKRVLRPQGRLIAMLYAKYSLNYLLSICILRRAALALMYYLPVQPGGKVGQHLASARASGIFSYLRIRNFVHKNTDGPLNPYSKVYSLREVKRDFPAFKVLAAHKEFMHAPPLPVAWMPLKRVLGWHLWIELGANAI